MARNLLVASNPTRARKRKQSPKQRAASLRNLRKARTARKRPSRRRNPSRKAATSTARTTRRRTTARRSTARRSPARRVAKRRNPVRKLSVKGIVDRQLMPALVGGSGAAANDIAYSFLLGQVPATFAPQFFDQLRAGPLRHAGKAASALVLAYLAGYVVPRKTADQLGAGAITVVGYNVVRDVLAKVAPDLTLGAYIEPVGLGYAGAGRVVNGGRLPSKGSDFRRSGLSAYLKPRLRGLSSVRQLTQGGQLTNANPYSTRRPVSASESYGDDLGT